MPQLGQGGTHIRGSEHEILKQRATTLELLVQLVNAGVELNPTQIRALTASDAITAYGSQTQKLLQRASTYDALVQIRHEGTEKDPTQIRALTASDIVKLDINASRTNVLATWHLQSTATDANQSIGSHTVTTGKTYYIQSMIVLVVLTVQSTTQSRMGILKIQIGGSDWIANIYADNPTSAAVFGGIIPVSGLTQVAAGVKVEALVTPSVVTSIEWCVTIIGFEK